VIDVALVRFRFDMGGGKQVLVILGLVAPWINPFAPGPWSTVLPWLISLLCFTLVFPIWAISKTCPSSSHPPLSPMQPIAKAWLIAALISAVLGIFQYFGWSSYFGPAVNQTLPGEAFANLRQRNQYASLVNIGLVSLMWLAQRRPMSQIQSSSVYASAVLLGVANEISGSRTGFFQLIFLTLICTFWRPRFLIGRQLLGLSWLAYCTSIWGLPKLTGVNGGLLARAMDAGSSCSSRLVLWDNVLDLMKQKPWFGWGWGELDYAHYVTLYDGPRFCEILDNAHNLPLHLAVELGVPVALLVCGGFIWWVLGQRPWRETYPARQLAWSVLAVILLHSMLEYPLWYGPFQMAFWICIALLWRRGQTFKTLPSCQLQGSNSLPAGILRTASATVFIASLGYAAWDYHRVSQIYLAPQERDLAYREDTLAKIRGSWLFSNQVRFAELLLMPLTRENAQWTFDTATALLHFSPEPRVIEKVIESAVMLGNDSEALAHLARFKAAFPEEHARWAKENGRRLPGLQLQN
jgi:Virulence factor membrane-bound polymerase, C-terminal/O-Antigen ligase/Protein glycosylation ligase